MPRPKSPASLSSDSVVGALLPWFAAHARDLPWRRTLDPYAIWISEIMLQQTQVKTVIPYWERWLKRLSTVTALAAAPEADVLKLWEGLGYYTRARNLRRAAQFIVENHGGVFPRNFADVLALPGIGRYTAGAIASIAYNEPAPILDGNVIRVLTRLGALRGDPKEKQLNARLWELAEELVATAAKQTTIAPPVPHSSGPCSALNQALMELGATVCTPRAPTCLVCPLAALCVAGRLGQAEAFPESKARAEITGLRFAVVVLERQGRFLARQRPAGTVNGGLWEFPNLELTPDAVAREIAADWLSLPAGSLVALKGVKHSITRYRIALEVFRAQAGSRVLPVEAGAVWRTPVELDQLAFTSAHRRILRQLL